MICDYCKLEMGDHVSCTHRDSQTTPHDGDEDCHDCYCPPGGLHHPGCDMERCALCGGQAVGCDCVEESL